MSLKKRKTSTLGITNPLMDDAATVLNTFYGGDPVLQDSWLCFRQRGNNHG